MSLSSVPLMGGGKGQDMSFRMLQNSSFHFYWPALLMCSFFNLTLTSKRRLSPLPNEAHRWWIAKKNGPFVRKSGLNVCWVCKFNSRQRKKTGAMLQTVQLDNWLLKDVCIHPIYFVNQSGQLLTDLAAIPKFYQPYSTSFYTTLFCSMLF